MTGEWRFCERPGVCEHCRRWVERAWLYFVGPVSHHTVCDECAKRIS